MDQIRLFVLIANFKVNFFTSKTVSNWNLGIIILINKTYWNVWQTFSGISIIYIKPRPAPPSMLSFLSPFTLEVWVYTAFGKKNHFGSIKMSLFCKVLTYSQTCVNDHLRTMTTCQQRPTSIWWLFLGPKIGRCTQVWLYKYPFQICFG